MTHPSLFVPVDFEQYRLLYYSVMMNPMMI